jgi:hypothetical protein
MRLLTAHKILIAAASALGAVLIVWGAVHGARGQSSAWGVLALGLVMLPLGVAYFIKLRRNPPIR